MSNLLQNPVSILFLLFIFGHFTAKYWLSNRQTTHIHKHQNKVPATFTNKITLEQHQNAAKYALARHRIGKMNLLLSALFLIIWTFGGALSSLSVWMLNVTAHPLHYGVLLLIIFSFINNLLDLPLSYYSQFVIEKKFGFNRMKLSLWLIDLLKSSLISCVIGIPLLYAILAFTIWQPDSWWLWSWVLFICFNLLAMWLYPTFIAPLFNQFNPLETGTLKTRLDSLLTRCGFKSNGMFVMDGSRRSAHGNAYFTGFGKNKRIVFFDTLLKQLTEPQVEAVLAHELGHFHHKHLIKRLIIIFPMSLVVFALLGYLSQQLWFYNSLGINSNTSLLKTLSQTNSHLFATGLILFTLILPIFTFFLTPMVSRGSRRDEFQADTFAVNNSNGQDLIDGLVNMYQENASFVETDALYSSFYDSHPPAVIRIAHIKKLIDQQAKVSHE